jgi:hypothetical protein
MLDPFLGSIAPPLTVAAYLTHECITQVRRRRRRNLARPQGAMGSNLRIVSAALMQRDLLVEASLEPDRPLGMASGSQWTRTDGR